MLDTLYQAHVSYTNQLRGIDWLGARGSCWLLSCVAKCPKVSDLSAGSCDSDLLHRLRSCSANTSAQVASAVLQYALLQQYMVAVHGSCTPLSLGTSPTHHCAPMYTYVMRRCSMESVQQRYQKLLGVSALQHAPKRWML